MNFYLLCNEQKVVNTFLRSGTALTESDVLSKLVLSTPDDSVSLVGSRYLGDEIEGLVTLGVDYKDFFEVPPQPNLYWNGKQWVGQS